MLNTAQKIFLARKLLSFSLFLGIKPNQRVCRHGVVFQLDLHEGIDLSLFLFGFFQKHILTTVKRFVPEDGIVIDVGANIGAITLPIANILPKGRVFAIEPTDFAFSKLLRNISLNPRLANRISPFQIFIADRSSTRSVLVAYSSWLLTDANSIRDTHPIHKGICMPGTCGQITLDEFVAKQNLQALSLIKIDTDGHEFKVLNGANKCIDQFRPIVIFEACEYLMKAPNPIFEDYEHFFNSHSYHICGTGSIKQLTAAMFKERCPRGGGLDLLAIPNERET
jgi:FkbM family methyltransferase